MTQERDPSGEVEEVRTLEMGGRTIKVREPGALQLSLVVRILKRVERAPNPTGEQVIDAMAKAMTMIESMIVEEEDRDAVVDMMLSREVDEMEIAKILQVFMTSKPEAKKTVARRKPPKRAPKG